MDTVRTTNKRGRASYHPEWHEKQPWVCYIDGKAYINCQTLDDCRRFFKRKGMTLDIKEKGV